MGKMVYVAHVKAWPSRAKQVEVFVAHEDHRKCDKLLRESDIYNTSACEPDVFVCICGRAWRHVCDEAEGCSYVEDPDFKTPVHKVRV